MVSTIDLPPREPLPWPLTTMVLFQNFHVGNSRSTTESAFRRSLFSNPFLLVAAASALAVHTASLYLAPTQFVLRVEPIEIDAWMRIISVALSVIAAVELHKLARRGGVSRTG